ncbi:MAG TPA: 16S rRNA (cytosine(967)-C(5))-methyltransferase RsmB [Arenimonas sp.]|nr:16S rRNA (cytosine(967)-C(5))-methyltransferase RsmB [Arenimonas sp.]
MSRPRGAGKAAAPPGAALRAQAATLLDAVLGQGRSLKAELAASLPGITDPRDRALLEALCFEALRHRRRYEFAVSHWLERPLAQRDRRIQMLLLVGLAQLDALLLPAHAALAATAEAARLLQRPALVGLVNAVLRRATREPLPHSDDPGITHSHPDWLLERLRQDWPQDWPGILEANNRPAPLWLRASQSPGRAAVIARLQASGVAASAPDSPPRALRIDARLAVQQLPGWHEGAFSVQDGAAQLAVDALAPLPGMRVLDACAAPGGKTAQLREAVGDSGLVLALDVDARRLARVRDTLQRLQLRDDRVQLHAGDAGEPARWWDGQAFDAILLDAPCSATGVIRRQPDIKWHRRADDIAALVAQQARLLVALWPLLRPGGRLLYATCSVLQDENARQIDAFLCAHPDAEAVVLDARFGRGSGAGRQRLPGEDGMDGFFYALLERRG